MTRLLLIPGYCTDRPHILLQNCCNLSTAARWIEPLPEGSDPVAFAETIQPQVIVIRLQPAIQYDQQVVEALLKNPQTSAIPVVVICLELISNLVEIAE